MDCLLSQETVVPPRAWVPELPWQAPGNGDGELLTKENPV